MKQLESWELDRMIRRLRRAEGALPSGEAQRLTAIVRRAAVNMQLPDEEWAYFDRVISAKEAEAAAQDAKPDEEAKRNADAPETDMEAEGAAIFIREMMRMQNEAHGGQRRRR